MRGWLFAGCLIVAWADSAHCQSYYPAQSDPCLPPAPTGLLGAITGPIVTRERVEACAQERKAQWDDYYAKQKAEKDEQDAALARQKDEQAAAEDHEQREEEERLRAALRIRWSAYRALKAAENSPENHCKQPEIARQIIEAWSSFDTFQELGIKAVDIEHLTTTAFDPSSTTMSCHGVFITNRGRGLIGTIQIRPNVAGDLITSWRADVSQDLSAYEAPPSAPPEAVEQATSRTVTAPPSAPAPQPSANPSFAEGLADRQHLETWRASLSGDEQAGANWWAANRSVKNHKECATAAVAVADQASWLAGCMNAQQKLTPSDLKRRADPDYKKGWNSY